MELIWCPPGGLLWGLEGENPAHPVILTKGFYLGKYEVTQEQYEKVMGKNPSQFKGDKLPVEKVSWNDAVEFCEELTKRKDSEVGSFLCLPRHSGSTRVERVQKRYILGATCLKSDMLIIIITQ